MATTPSSSANALNRELLRWIQSLDLAYSIKNVKRDFSNGFLIAEILSRYYDKEISMHSYDNGIGSKVKKDNWDQLNKFFKKTSGLDNLISKEETDAIIHCENGAVVNFLKKLYKVLTSREIQEVQKNKELDVIPPYAKTTGSSFIRDKMRDPGIAELVDELTIENKVREIHSSHEEQLQRERILDQDRFFSSSSSSFSPSEAAINNSIYGKVMRASTRTVEHTTAIPPPSSLIKEVQIKTIHDKNFAHLRATKNSFNSTTTTTSSFSTLTSISTSTSSLNVPTMCPTTKTSLLSNESSCSSNTNTKNSNTGSALGILNMYILRKLKGNPHFKKDNASIDPLYIFFDFIKKSRKQELSDEEISNVLGDMADEVPASLYFMDPKEFGKISSLFYDVLQETTDDSLLFKSTVNLLIKIGKACTKVNTNAANALLADFGMKKLCSILSVAPGKRPAILEILYSFTCSENTTSHIQLIKCLKDTIEEIPTFIYCLSDLIYLEKVMDETLLDLYLYYCSIGLETPSPKLCAACIGMYGPLMNFKPSIVIEILPGLEKFSSPTAWWEIKAQLIVVCSAVLKELLKENDTPAKRSTLSLALDIIRREVDPKSPLNVRRIALSHLSHNLHHFPELVPLFVDILMSIPTDLKEMLLSNSFPLALGGSTCLRFDLTPITVYWDAYAIARQLFHDNFSSKAIEMSYDQLVILGACAKHIAQTDIDRLYDLYADFRDWIIQALEQDSCCGIASEILTEFILRLEIGDEVLKLSTFLHQVVQAIQDENETRQHILSLLLKDICTEKNTLQKQVAKFMEQVAEETGKTFQQSILHETFVVN